MSYTVAFARSARRELEWLPAKILDRILMAIRGLQHDARPMGSQKLVGGERMYRIRVGHYRVIYQVDDKARAILIARVRHRKDAYQ